MQLHGIILAAGKGKRMRSKNLPKVLYQLAGKPLIGYVVESLEQLGVDNPVIVVGFQGQKVIETLGSIYRYAWQKKRLGTAHAALQARPFLQGSTGYTFILYGDNPLLSAATLRRIVQDVEKKRATVAVAAAKAPEELGLGHIVTNKAGIVVDIVEKKVATEEIKKEYPWQNAGGWLVENQFLWQALPKIKKHPISGESYLTDLVGLAVEAGKKVIAVPVADPAEAIGVNTAQHLQQAQQWLRTKQKE